MFPIVMLKVLVFPTIVVFCLIRAPKKNSNYLVENFEIFS